MSKSRTGRNEIRRDWIENAKIVDKYKTNRAKIFLNPHLTPTKTADVIPAGDDEKSSGVYADTIAFVFNIRYNIIIIRPRARNIRRHCYIRV